MANPAMRLQLIRTEASHSEKVPLPFLKTA